MINNGVIESYLNCPYKAYRMLNNEHGVKKEFELFQRNQLSSCKTEFNNTLLEKYSENDLLKDFKFKNNTRISKVNFHIQPALNTETFQISFDAVEIISDKNSSLNNLHLPILVSSKERISKVEKLSICIKCVILHQLFGINYEFGKIIHGPELKTTKFKIEPFLTEAKRILTDLHKMSIGESKPLVYQKRHCKICEFQEICEKELVEKDSLGRLHRMGKKDIKKYNNKGIFTVEQLSYTFRPRKRNRRVQTKTHLYYLSLQALAIREQKVYLYDKIDLPNPKTKIFIDMEGNSSGSFIYLIGILVIENGEEKKYSLWANDFDDEKEIFNECMKILNGLNDVHIFYFGKYESRVFKRMLKCNPPNKVKDLILNKSANILTVIYSNIYFPTYSNSLKEIGKYLGCSWSAINPSGIQSIVWRKKWESSNDPKLKDTLITYNYEDCIALKTLTDFIYSIFDDKTLDDLKKLDKIALAEELKNYDENLPYGPMDFVSKDIKVITKCAYFEYQRNKIFFRTNKNVRKANLRKAKQQKRKIKPNKIITISSYKCPFCKSKNISRDKINYHEKINIDLRISPLGIKRWITIYQCPFYVCFNCKRGSKGFKPKKFTKIRKYGQNLQSWTLYQYIVNRSSLGNIERTLIDYFGLRVPVDRLWKFKIKTAKYYNDTYDKIMKKILNGNLIHADETKIKLQKESGFVWVLTNMEEVIYLYRPNRESGFLHDLLKGFNGVLVTDFYPGYDSFKCPQQKCLVHLIRDLNNSLLKNPSDDELKKLVIMFGSLIRKIIDTIDRHGLRSIYMRKHKKDVKMFYKEIVNTYFSSDIAETFRKRMVKYEEKLFLFLDYDNIPWNNNNAEHAIKYFAKYRRLVNGKINQQGLDPYLILLSVYQTCNYKGINFLYFLLSKERDIDRF